jgi:hypothetical protein
MALACAGRPQTSRLKFDLPMRITAATTYFFEFLLLLVPIACHQQNTLPLGDATTIEFPRNVPQSAKGQLLTGDFKIITTVNGLSPSVQKTFQEKGGSRMILANPGEGFNPSDVISDPTVPQRRLIFAGVSGDKNFVHYEQGGRGYSYVIEVFKIRPGAEAQPLWRGYCREPAENLEKLRSQTESGKCS